METTLGVQHRNVTATTAGDAPVAVAVIQGHMIVEAVGLDVAAAYTLAQDHTVDRRACLADVEALVIATRAPIVTRSATANKNANVVERVCQRSERNT